MDWSPVTKQELVNEMEASRKRMSDTQGRFWKAVRIEPEKWQQHPFGDQGGGFWVVGLVGRSALWYNDIEEGFNLTRYSKWGQIDEYGAEQDQLEWLLGKMLDRITKGHPGLKRGGPKALF